VADGDGEICDGAAAVADDCDECTSGGAVAEDNEESGEGVVADIDVIGNFSLSLILLLNFMS